MFLTRFSATDISTNVSPGPHSVVVHIAQVPVKERRILDARGTLVRVDRSSQATDLDQCTLDLPTGLFIVHETFVDGSSSVRKLVVD